MLESANASAARLAQQWNKVGVGGSDAHALPSVGMAYTEVPGARNKEEFFAGLQRGTGRAAGDCGSFARLTRDVLIISAGLMRERAWTRLLAPLGLLVPLATAMNYCQERAFHRRWAARVLTQSKPKPRKATVPSYHIHTEHLAFQERAIASGG